MNCSRVSAESKRLVWRTSAIRPLKHSTMPLVSRCLGRINRCSMQASWQTLPKGCWSEGFISPPMVKRSVKLVFYSDQKKLWQSPLVIGAIFLCGTTPASSASFWASWRSVAKRPDDRRYGHAHCLKHLAAYPFAFGADGCSLVPG